MSATEDYLHKVLDRPTLFVKQHSPLEKTLFTFYDIFSICTAVPLAVRPR